MIVTIQINELEHGAIDKSQRYLMSVLLSTPSTMTFCSNACLYLSESVVSLLLGSPLIFQIVLPVFFSFFLVFSLFLASYSVWFAAGFGSGTSSIHPLYR